MNDLNDVPAPTSRQAPRRQAPRRQAPRRHVPVRTALVALLGLLAAGCGGAGPEQTKGPAPESQELTLQPVGASGPDPFTASSATAESAPVQPPLPNPSGRGIRTVGAATPGLYGGTSRLGSCDVERQIAFLTSDHAKSRAFAQATGVGQEKLPDFLRALTPVVLRADTRVTNHGFREGRADGYQAVLQAGTAVLVDEHGMPRVRCGCGNPLAPPRSAKGSPVLKGDQWNGYQPNQVIVIEPTAQVINRLVIVNIADNTWIERKAGDDGAQDKTPRLLPPYDPADGIPNGPATPTVDPSSDPCTAADPNSLARTVPPTPPSATPSGPPAGPPAGPPYPESAGPLAGAPYEGPADPLAGAPYPEFADPQAGPPYAGPSGPPSGPPSAGPAEPPSQADPPVAPPANPPVAPQAAPPAAPQAAPSASPCPSEAGTVPRAPGLPQDPPSGGLPPSDLPSGPSSDAPADLPPDQRGAVPSEPGVPPVPVPDDGPAADPALPADPDGPADPYGFPDQEPAADQPPYLESA
ncbi:DUF6777 domain-containing protein [Streptomyces sp. NBC_00091]|uniref:DUF6777 domain-containing protein n=1 Tax=Streptomyces sp. NBC_00091 TaxID=2975648 RepID=UPI0022533314|nr:DUF6777 domain-containing protein [Streptomyces sp. NBC_00091]MCX5380213.1 hypothetical protein [Streptomyces sp. NBC_00091]MCX5380920.1 hypothetical protein [Streptomyces sp. NBC_00091]